MEKRYQVFISSTYKDLQEERKTAMEAILTLDHFPAGMELFTASDEEQFKYIKQVIDASDYYILIIAGKYGTVAEDGISYTEKEFNYAKEKGIPILVFEKIISPNEIYLNIEDDPEKKRKLESFKEKAKTGRMISFWTNKEDLNSKILTALVKYTRTNPRVGWIRTNEINNSNELLKINGLMEENKNLKDEINLLKGKMNTKKEFENIPYRTFEEDFKIKVKMFNFNLHNSEQYYMQEFIVGWGILLIILSDALGENDEKNPLKESFDQILLEEIRSECDLYVEYVEVRIQDFKTILSNFLLSGDIEENGEEFKLTDKGRCNSITNRLNKEQFNEIMKLEGE